MCPFFRKYAAAIRSEIPEAIMFCEPVINFEDLHGDPPPRWIDEQDVGPGYVWAKHYYDGMTLITKQFRNWIGLDQLNEVPVFAHSNVVKAHANTLKHYAEEAQSIGSTGCPTLIGETGIPFDLGLGPGRNRHRAIAAMNTTMLALQRNMLNFTLWTYVVDNTFESGDQWCGEDLSIWSKDQERLCKEGGDPIYDGGRALPAVIRPYAHLVAGRPVKMSYDPYDKTRLFEFSYVPTLNDTTKKKKRRIHYDDAETSVFFIPQYVYRSEKETNIEVSPPGCVYKFDWNSQTLLVKNPVDTTDSLVFVRVSLKKQRQRSKRSKTPTRKKR